MAQLAAFPEDSWQQVVCRICKHPFAIAVEDAQVAEVVLCQTCSILVDRFGQEDAPPSPPPLPQPARTAEPPKRANKVQRRQRQHVELASLIDRWGELWRSTEEHEAQL